MCEFKRKKWTYHKILVQLQLLTKKLLLKFQNLHCTKWVFSLMENFMFCAVLFNVLLWNGRWISYWDKSENLQVVKNEDLAINTSKWKLCVASNQFHYQLYYWLRSDIAVIPEIDLSENGWIIVKGNVQPVSFVGRGSHLISFLILSEFEWIELTSIPLEIIKNYEVSEFQGE